MMAWPSSFRAIYQAHTAGIDAELHLPCTAGLSSSAQGSALLRSSPISSLGTPKQLHEATYRSGHANSPRIFGLGLVFSFAHSSPKV